MCLSVLRLHMILDDKLLYQLFHIYVLLFFRQAVGLT